jgi:hypothetical protein
MRRRNVWRDCGNDAVYQGMVDKALQTGVEPVEA